MTKAKPKKCKWCETEVHLEVFNSGAKFWMNAEGSPHCMKNWPSKWHLHEPE